MTIEQLEERVHRLEREVAELRGELVLPLCSVDETFGIAAEGSECDEFTRPVHLYRGWDDLN
jgi:hypothetical protein